MAIKRNKLVYTGDTQPKRESVLTPHYASPIHQVKIGEGEVKMHISCSGAMDLDHSHGYFIRPKTSGGRILQWCWSTVFELPSHCEKSTTKSNCVLVPTKARSMSKMGGDSKATKMSPKY